MSLGRAVLFQGRELWWAAQGKLAKLRVAGASAPGASHAPCQATLTISYAVCPNLFEDFQPFSNLPLKSLFHKQIKTIWDEQSIEEWCFKWCSAALTWQLQLSQLIGLAASEGHLLQSHRPDRFCCRFASLQLGSSGQLQLQINIFPDLVLLP